MGSIGVFGHNFTMQSENTIPAQTAASGFAICCSVSATEWKQVMQALAQCLKRGCWLLFASFLVFGVLAGPGYDGPARAILKVFSLAFKSAGWVRSQSCQHAACVGRHVRGQPGWK